MAPATRQSQRIQQRHVSTATPQSTAKKITKSNTTKVTHHSSSATHQVASKPNKPDVPELLVPDVAAWRAWLDANESISNGIWLIHSKGGHKEPTSLTGAQALDEALCSGWINGQGRSRDDKTVFSRYTPRRAKSLWSAINVGHVARLRGEGRMRPRGEEEVEKAMADGRWERAYPGSKGMKVPKELLELLEDEPDAKETVESWTSGQRYTALLPIAQATTNALRMKRIEALAKKLIDVSR